MGLDQAHNTNRRNESIINVPEPSPVEDEAENAGDLLNELVEALDKVMSIIERWDNGSTP